MAPTHLVARFHQEGRRDGGVHSSGHGHEDLPLYSTSQDPGPSEGGNGELGEGRDGESLPGPERLSVGSPDQRAGPGGVGPDLVIQGPVPPGKDLAGLDRFTELGGIAAMASSFLSIWR